MELRAVTKVFPTGEVALDEVSLRIPRGELAFLVGPSGSGKSTVLRLILKELEPTHGRVLIAGRELGRLPRRRVPYLRRNVGVAFQDFKLLPDRTVFGNVAYPLEVIGERRAQVGRKVTETLQLFGLWEQRASHPGELSGAEQERVALARAFVNRPPLLLADEPTGSLDPGASIGIVQLLHRINSTGTTVLVATHDRGLVERVPRRAIELRAGRVVHDELWGLSRLEGSTAELALRVRRELGIPTGAGT